MDWLWTADTINEIPPLPIPIPQRVPQSTYKPRSRLRDSCNSCAASKVKCSKEQPICARCEDRDYVCQYSPTKRIGKRRVWPQSMPEGVAAGTDMTLQVTQESIEGLSPITDYLGMNKSSFPTTTEQSYFNFLMDAPMQYGMIASNNATLTPGSFEDCESHLSMLSHPSAVIPISSSSAVPDSISNGPQHCMGSAIELMTNIYIPPTTCTLCPSTSSVRLDSFLRLGSRQKIEDVLSYNKDALNSINLMLGCPCSLDVQLVLLLTSIIMKITCSYSDIAQESALQTPPPTPTPVSTPTVLSGLEYGLSRPIQLDDYRFDLSGDKKEEQSVLCELHLLVRTVEHLVRRFADIAQYDKERRGNGAENLAIEAVFAHLEKYLRCQAQMLAKDIVDSLRHCA